MSPAVLKNIHQTEEEFQEEARSTLLGHGSTPEEIAEAVRFILDARAMTGQMIALDGGQHLTWPRSRGSEIGPLKPGARSGNTAMAPFEFQSDKSLRPAHRALMHGLELMASVGIYEIEKRYEQRIAVSVDLMVRDDYDGRSDRLEDVFDYGRVVQAGREISESGHFHLIETLAERIAAACLLDERVNYTVEKPDILTGCRSVGIAIERARTGR